MVPLCKRHKEKWITKSTNAWRNRSDVITCLFQRTRVSCAEKIKKFETHVKTYRLYLCHLQESTSICSEGLKRCFEGFVSRRNCPEDDFVTLPFAKLRLGMRQYMHRFFLAPCEVRFSLASTAISCTASTDLGCLWSRWRSFGTP